MNLIIDLWMLMIASTFFAGIYGVGVMKGHEPLHGLRWMLAAKAIDGLIIGMATIALIRAGDIHEITVQWLWMSIAAKGAVSISVWVFVLDIAGKLKRKR